MISKNVEPTPMTNSQLRTYKRLLDIAKEYKWEVISDKYEGNINKMIFKCPSGHFRKIAPKEFKIKPGCAECRGTCPIVAARNFKNSVKIQGGDVIGKYVNCLTRVECLCIEGHVCHPIPVNIRDGGWICIKCSGMCPQEIEKNFILGIEKMGGSVVGKYITTFIPVECLCPFGHTCFPVPFSIKNGQSMCKICPKKKVTRVIRDYEKVNLRQQDLYNKILKIAIENKWEVLSSNYEKNNIKMTFKCPNNHIREMTPHSFIQNHGCLKCAGKCPITAENNFIILVKRCGGKVVGRYNGCLTPVECLCQFGHTCFPSPKNLKIAKKICSLCSKRTPAKAKAAFFYNVERLGGEVIGNYVNSYTPVKCLCKNKHLCNPRPGCLQQGEGLCRKCQHHCPIEVENIFIAEVTRLEGKVIGKYTYSTTPIHCLCKNGHDCYPTPDRLRCLKIFCVSCIVRTSESFGERLVSKILNSLGINHHKQAIFPSVKRLKFDFKFEYNNKTYYVEFDGEQHQNYIPHLHKSIGKFESGRQRDLLKNYVIKKSKNCILIRLDHKWIQNRRLSTMENIEFRLRSYIKNCLNENNDIKIIANPIIYDWIDDNPSAETISKYC